MAIEIRGLAWDHRRCWGPLDASVTPYRAANPDIRITWDRRSLYEFGEGRIEDVVRQYDLVIFDHPFIGDIASAGLMVPFDRYLSEADRRRFEADSVGASWRSYQALGRQWALPIDAAAQVAAYRPDLLLPYAEQLPTTEKEVKELGRRLRRDGKWIGLPLVPTDAMCLVVSLAAGGGEPIGTGGGFLPCQSIERIIATLREFAELAHPKSREWNPIRCYDHMIANDDVVYVPYAFGYVNYASRQEAPLLAFGDIPATPPSGALLGGAGIGVSAFSANPDAAAAYALFLCSEEYQRTDYLAHGGQPGSRAAWTDAAANELTRGFFRDTLATLSQSYLRPTHPGFVDFFRSATHQVVAAIDGEIAPAALADWLDRRYLQSLEKARPERSAV
ncbi:extracellular solute-binding protein [Mesorhizobium sp. BAC0120]|uniref:extracellular solute-binding protein n=1 Tax=Mesorhizobium sp. BAC0120 TaxID=3090670 RepID=UPI00298D2EC7|nr:extracellular solute-binding protein [Mesorhizobium sp. BAC0120]MDW6020301.1 extracellular solute-binding protein [Mesorhizobium sp. BAC0120]